MSFADDDQPTIIFGATVEKTTDKALLVFNHEANESQWVPRSAVLGGDEMEEGEDHDDFEMAEWKAKELGWA